MNESFGAVLRDLRVKAGLSQSKLADRAGYDHSFLSRIEGGTRMPSRDTVQSLAEALNLSGDDQDRLYAAGKFMPMSIGFLLSCPLLNDLDEAHRAATPERKAWIESIARLALEAAA